jgi:meiotic recombination protein SPO11
VRLTNIIVYSIPVVALVDADPHGLDILSTYKFGSHTMMHENELLVAPRLEWIGVKRSDIEE